MEEHEYLTNERYTYPELKTLGKAIKAELEKIKMFKKIKRSKEQETREVKRTIDCILENTLELMTQEDSRNYLTRKLLELGGGIPTQS
jgi:hypothetical protein